MIISLKYPLLCLNSNRFLYNGLPGKIASFQPPVAVSFLASHFCCGLRAPLSMALLQALWCCETKTEEWHFNTKKTAVCWWSFLMPTWFCGLKSWQLWSFFQKFNDSDFNMTVVVIEVEIKLCIPRDSKSPAQITSNCPESQQKSAAGVFDNHSPWPANLHHSEQWWSPRSPRWVVRVCVFFEQEFLDWRNGQELLKGCLKKKQSFW